jgi:hypothetical protein
MTLRNKLIKLNWFLSSQLGINVRRFLYSLRGIPPFLRDWKSFRREYGGPIKLMPCLHDRYEEGGDTKSEYFWQDLLVARWIFEASPVKHVDIGSRVDGFVAHVASFRDIEVVDVRPITTQIPGVTFKQADLMSPVEGMMDYCDSLSCLHALEHFGLGRYGDPIDPKGYKLGFKNMANLLKEEGTFYLSVPIGIERVEFNANRVFDPQAIVSLAGENLLRLTAIMVVRQEGQVETLELNDVILSGLANQRYALGIFTFVKLTSSAQV